VYARGKIAWGNCDRCGFRFLLNTLRAEAVKGVSRNNRVCASCWDPDHPQNWLGTFPIYDPQALRNPRPDVAETAVDPYEPAYVGPGNEP
jgi:hypothetical protein